MGNATYTAIIRWEEKGADGYPVAKEFRDDVTDSVNEYIAKGEYDEQIEAEMLDNRAFKIADEVGDKMIWFTTLYIEKEA